jgi:phosphodiesterase/alkaline phosphatase D-like protein
MEPSTIPSGWEDSSDTSIAARAGRRTPHAPHVIYRVRVDGLKPGTTYYYMVDSTQADGTSIGVKSAVNQFTTRQHP